MERLTISQYVGSMLLAKEKLQLLYSLLVSQNMQLSLLHDINLIKSLLL